MPHHQRLCVAAQQTMPTALQMGSTMRQEMKPGEAHEYTLELAAGQFAKLQVELRASVGQANVSVMTPTTQLHTQVEYLWATRRMTVGLLAEQTGPYRILIKSASETDRRFSYQLRVVEVRAAQPADQSQLILQQLLTATVSQHAVPRQTQEQWLAQLSALESQFSATDEVFDLLAALGSVQRNLNQRAAARATLLRALTLAQQRNDAFSAATLLATLGDLAAQQLDYSKAKEYYLQARQVAHTVNHVFLEAYASMNGARILWQTDEPSLTLESYQNAYRLFYELGDASGWLMALSNQGTLYTEIGEYQAAFDAFQRVLREAPPRYTFYRYEAELGLAFAYWQLGELTAARAHYERALSNAPNEPARGPTLSGLGAVAVLLGETATAEKLFEEALPYLRQGQDKRNEALALGGLGLVAEAQNDLPRALKLFEEGLALAQRNLDRYLEGLALVKIGHLYRRQSQTAQAQDFLTRALAHSQKIRDGQVETEANFGLAQLAYVAGDAAAARAYNEAALKLIETGRQKIGSLAVRSAHFANAAQPYEFHIQLLQEQHRRTPAAGFAARALEISERARSRSLLEMLAEKRVDLRADVPATLLARERELQQQLNGTNEQQFKLLSRFHLKMQAEEVQKRLDRLTLELQEVQTRIRTTSPRYAALTAPQPLTVTELQAQLDAETTLLEYALGEQQSYLWVVTKDALQTYSLPARRVIEAQALLVRKLLTARQPSANESATQRAQRIAEADANYPAAAAQLSQMLLAPAAAQLKTPRLAIVADGALQYVPFAALPINEPATSGSAKPLITRFELVSLPSASSLALLRRALTDRPTAPKTLAVFADPVFEEDDPRVLRNKKTLPNLALKLTPASDSMTEAFQQAALTRSWRDLDERTGTEASTSAPGFGRLLASRREANRLLALVPTEQRMAALDFKAARATALDPQLNEYRYLHFATHGVLNEIHPELSGIVLSLRDEKGAEQDGFLRLHEIYQLNLKADLVTLSACQTGLGKHVRGEGLVGLTRGFMYAGAPRIVASLWKVQDEGAAELMNEFYRALLREGQRPAAALRAAQLNLLAKPTWQHPFFWAAFTLQGEWR